MTWFLLGVFTWLADHMVLPTSRERYFRSFVTSDQSPRPTTEIGKQ